MTNTNDTKPATAHTPEPWLYGDAGIATPGGDVICEAPIHYLKSREKWKDNGPLIAAAPTMLEALLILEKRCTALGWSEPEMRIIYHAIAEANGRAA